MLQMLAQAATTATTTAATMAASVTTDSPAQDLMQRMWTFDYGGPWWEFVVRGLIIYIFVLVLIRITGKRQVGQLAPFDLVLLLILSNAVQNSMNGGDNSVLGGMISAMTLVGTNYFVGYLTFKSKFLEGIIKGRPVMLIHNGCVNHRNLKSVRMTMHELNSSLRANGCAGVHEVMMAVLENSGEVTVIGKHGHQHDTPNSGAHVHPGALPVAEGKKDV